MPIFAVIAIRDPSKIKERLDSLSPDSYPVTDSAWLATFDGTTDQFADRLGVRHGETGTGLVLPVRNYSGRGPADMWEWLELHWRKEMR